MIKGRTINDKYTHPLVYELNNKFMTTKYLNLDNNGLYIFAESMDRKTYPDVKMYKNYILKKPYSTDNKWFIKFSPNLIKKKDLWMKNTLKYVNKIIKTPAGNFKQCIKTKAIHNSRIKNSMLNINHVSLLIPEAKLQVEEHKWYAPGIGLIKHIYMEHLERLQIKDQPYRYILYKELTNYTSNYK
jgi:hypothetical protein